MGKRHPRSTGRKPGRPVLVPGPLEQVATRIPQPVFEELRIIAKREGQSITQMVRVAVVSFIEKRQWSGVLSASIRPIAAGKIVVCLDAASFPFHGLLKVLKAGPRTCVCQNEAGAQKEFEYSRLRACTDTEVVGQFETPHA